MTQKDTEMENVDATAPQDAESSRAPNGTAPAAKKDEKDTKGEEELSEEDQQLKSELEMLVERLKVCDYVDYGRISRCLTSCARGGPTGQSSRTPLWPESCSIAQFHLWIVLSV
ncbi:hypothetical protein V1525DRAFT_421256 [Lipomyces kononenkoae]|uniref:Uncharacterized protein n=1 Tax=Lipomyces kononenkoae TaxID=34357 RepID=A0ACC3SV69_LIPKO